MTKRFAIFASGTGSNAQALMESATSANNIKIVFVMTDQPDAKVTDKAQNYGIPFHIFPIVKKSGQTFSEAKLEQESQISELVEKEKIDYILMAGYMRILSQGFVKKFYGKIINIHPSLLPEFPGRDGYGDAFQEGVKESGITIHYVDSGVDTGPIIIQEKFPRIEGDTLQTFKSRGLALEHRSYPQVMQWLAEDKVFLNSQHQVERKV